MLQEGISAIVGILLQFFQEKYGPFPDWLYSTNVMDRTLTSEREQHETPILNGMLRAAGRIRPGASCHQARVILELRKTDPLIRAAVNFSNPPGFAEWLQQICRENGWLPISIDRRDEPAPVL